MKILIIGNGFDLNLGLKTSYKDFIESSQFQNLVDSENSMALYFNEKNEINNWVDIEREITAFSTNITNEGFNLKEDFNSIKNALMEYLEEAQNKEIDENSKAFEIIKELDTVDYIFNFNYTNSILRIANILNIQFLEDKHCYIHGSLKEQNIIFGVEDDARVQSNHIFFKKAYNKNHGIYNVKSTLVRENEIIIFGHSLGVTDSSYFKSYINDRSTFDDYVNLKFYYYGESGWDEMMKIIDDYTYNNITKFRANNFFPVDSSK